MAVTTESYQNYIPTRRSLLERLKDLEDEASWKDFFNTYWRLIYSVALRAGLRAADAEDVVQETVVSVAKTIGKYRYDPKVTFKGWLFFLVRKRIADHLRKKSGREVLLQDARVGESPDASWVEQVPDPAQSVLDAVWEEEWQRNLIEAALEKLKSLVSMKQYQIFYLHVIKEQPAKVVATSFNVSTASVHLAKHRVQPLFRKAIAEVERSAGEKSAAYPG
jgi:RNA polymerase sigma-70 factor (ECF subfamily)